MAVIAKRLVVRLATAAKRQSYVFDDDGTIGRPELNAPTCIQGAVRHGYNRYLLVRHLRCAAIAPRIVQRSARAFRDYRGDCVRAGGGRQDPRPARGVEYHMQAAHAFCRVDATPPVVTYIDLVIGIVTNRVVHSNLSSLTFRWSRAASGIQMRGIRNRAPLSPNLEKTSVTLPLIAAR